MAFAECPFYGSLDTANVTCSYSVCSAGETMEHALTKVTKDIRLGKILIQTNSETKNPELYFLRLPRGIKHDHCVLMDASITTGAAGKSLREG